ncbi:glutamine synthetase family protein [Pseudonocardia asaccharolytica]|uniref:Glutamine synthetase n=1 Tax=Pseudonocardia asaccharolytica DSM 44247 = NBRC 16224 TaxID=1123024 RepID=A0A511DBH1_9PSEU|nr:glutamine synthetase family protein [Pseudonocardia asaccharolytica]GEL20288.1 glutamine synthetase [Pseudonocardia asaccharolytica DSM 44247 = NBRC 16224]
MGFIERHALYSDDQRVAAKDVLERVEREQLDVVRVVFADQHGLLRGKTVAASELGTVLRDGLTIVSTLLSKDTSGKTVYAAFSPDGGLGIAEMAGAGDMVMIPDPTTFRVLEWAGRTGWILCDLRFANGEPVPLCTRGLMRRAVERAARLGFLVKTGVEIEFHLFRAGPDDRAGDGLLNTGYQLLSEDRLDALGPIVTIFSDSLRRLGVPLRSIEIEFGPSQLEVTLGPEIGIRAADTVILLRSALKQIARRHDLHLTFMCRPQIPEVFSSGWHLHQSLLRPAGEGPVNAFIPEQHEAILSTLGQHYLAGQLRHARAASAFAVPTINGYKRFQPYSMAPDRVLWGRDNRAAMLRVTGSAADGSTHLENRVGEPGANPYLYMASQLIAGLNGVENKWELESAADEPYETDAPRLPATLGEAIDALAADTQFARAVGEKFVDYYIGIKRHELKRFHSAVTDWEQNEYFGLF